MKIIFMGTPQFAVPSLKALVEAGHEVVAVVTAPDKPAGRGQKLRPTPVKQYAVEAGLKVLTPVKLKDPALAAELGKFDADIGVVVAFRRLPEALFTLPKLGTFNLHTSLLPDYRGAAPINWVIINGETQTGLTTFFLQKTIDTGNILLQEKIDIPPDWTAGQLHDDMMIKGGKLVVQTVDLIASGKADPKPQDDAASIHPAPKIFKPDCRIDWDRPVAKLYNFIRGLSPYPTAWTVFDGKTLKIFETQTEAGDVNGVTPGTIRSDGKNFLKIAGKDGYLQLTTVQLEGKKRMGIEDFLRGFREIPARTE